MKFTQSVLGISVLALALVAGPAAAQSRGERAPQRHGSSRQAQPARQGPSRDSGPRASRGADSGASRAAVRASRGPAAVRGGPGAAYARGYAGNGYARSSAPSRHGSYASSRAYGSYGYASRGYGVAVPRQYAQRRHGGVYVNGGRYYRPSYRSYYYPSRFAFGFGYGWGYPYAFAGYPYLYSGFYGYGPGWGYGYGPYGYGYGGYGYGPYYGEGYREDEGGIRLQMNPKQAEVTVDGYFVGIVDDFDGVSQRLTLEEGPHRIEITEPGFEPFAIEVNILAQQTIRYRGALRPLP